MSYSSPSFISGKKAKGENSHSALLRNHYLMSISVSDKSHSNIYILLYSVFFRNEPLYILNKEWDKELRFCFKIL